jgi:hypothetical protein
MRCVTGFGRLVIVTGGSGHDFSGREDVIGMAAAQSAPDSGDPPNPTVSNTRRPPWWAGSWYFVVTIASFGLLAWIPFLHAAIRLRRRSLVVLTVIYAAAAVALIVLLAMTPTSGEAVRTIGPWLMVSTIVAGCAQQARLRRKVYPIPTTPR